MEVQASGQLPGSTFRADGPLTVRLAGNIYSARRLTRIEIVENGQVIETLSPANPPRQEGGFTSEFSFSRQYGSSRWLAVRCFESWEEGREKFAHTAPVHVDVEGKPLRPRRVEVEYLVERIEGE